MLPLWGNKASEAQNREARGERASPGMGSQAGFPAYQGFTAPVGIALW